MTLNDVELHSFNSLIGEPIIVDPDHQLELNWFKTRTGFIAICSCGERIGRNSMTGNNLAGWKYGLLATKQNFNSHVQKERAVTYEKEAIN